jgi:hypothetical protein
VFRAGRIVCVGHERFGEGSDADRSFQKGAYFTGPLFVDTGKKVYKSLFGRKGLLQGYGLFSISKESRRKVSERGVPGNLKGDGFQMGGAFVLGPDGTVFLDHRQGFYGDDPTAATLVSAVTAAGQAAANQAAANQGAANQGAAGQSAA